MKSISLFTFQVKENDGMFRSVKDVTQEFTSIMLQISIILSWKVINSK